MQQSLKNRLAALEQASGSGDEVFVLLFGDEVDAYDAALAAGDAAAAFEILREQNPYTSDEVLTRVVRGARHYRDLDGSMAIGATLIKARYGDE